VPGYFTLPDPETTTRETDTMTNIIPNTTPWTLLVEVFVDAEPDPCVTQYPLTGWRIDADGAHPVVCGEPYEPGDVVIENTLHGYSLHALMDGRSGACREVGGGDECAVDDLVRFARKRLETARRTLKVMSEATA
jgi:hypothetical protein